MASAEFLVVLLQTFQLNAKAYVVGSHDVLNFKRRQFYLGTQFELRLFLLRISGWGTQVGNLDFVHGALEYLGCLHGGDFGLSPSNHHATCGEDEGSGSWLANSHDHGAEAGRVVLCVAAGHCDLAQVQFAIQVSCGHQVLQRRWL